MTTQDVISNAVSEFEKIVAHLKDEYSRLQIGRANSALVENVPVEMYGVTQPVKALASISINDPRTIMIQPWDRSALAPIEKAIVGVGTGLNPVNDGICVRISIPPLTEERRVELTKVVKKLEEEARIAVRTTRQDANSEFKKMKVDSEITEDVFFAMEKKIQDHVESINGKIDELAELKTKDVMTV
jgi:ribosome recycling factor